MAENYLNDQPLVFDWSIADVNHARVKLARKLLAEGILNLMISNKKYHKLLYIA